MGCVPGDELRGCAALRQTEEAFHGSWSCRSIADPRPVGRAANFSFSQPFLEIEGRREPGLGFTSALSRRFQSSRPVTDCCCRLFQHNPAKSPDGAGYSHPSVRDSILLLGAELT
jgi:hypothetical protein